MSIVYNAGFSGQKDVAVAGTAEQLITVNKAGKVIVKAKSGNTGAIYIGFSSNSLSSNGYILLMDESVEFKLDGLNNIYIDSSVNGEGVSYIGVETK